MYKLIKPLYIHVQTPMHAGTGSELGVVDLPIQRERHTGYPKIEGSTLKGALRAAFRNGYAENNITKQILNLVFGPDSDDDAPDGETHAGALGLTDARILLFPVKSIRGIFAWVTCPAVLRKLQSAFDSLEPTQKLEWDVPPPSTVPKSNSLKVTADGDGQQKIILEEYTFTVSTHPETEKLVQWLQSKVLDDEKIMASLVVLEDDEFRDFVEMSTEVITRTKIDPQTGTVKQGALFTAEYLPTETILYTLTMAGPFLNGSEGDKKILDMYSGDSEEEKVMSYFTKEMEKRATFQIGGDATIGKGIVTIKI